MWRALAVAGLGIALTLAAATFDTPSLYVPGVALAVLALGALAWVWLAARGARVSRAPGPPTVVEEEPWPLRVELRTGLLPAPSGELLEPLLGWPVAITGRWSRRVRINVRFSRRGRRDLEPARLVIRDPMRLYVREVTGVGEEELIVLPRTEPVVAGGGGGEGKGNPLTGDRYGSGLRLHDLAAELELDALRPYREGTPATRIHWPAVARTGEMLERRLIADADSAPLVVLDAARPDSEDALDMAVRAAASLCLHLARSGGCGLLLPGERRAADIGPDLGAWPAAHVRLALVEAGSGRPALSRARRGGALIYVTGEGSGRPPRALERRSAASVWLVGPVPVRGRRASFTVAGCTGQRLDRRPARSAA